MIFFELNRQPPPPLSSSPSVHMLKSFKFCIAALSLTALWAVAADSPPPDSGVLPNGLRPADVERLKALINAPDIQGQGPYPATYEAAPDNLHYVVYHPVDISAAAHKRKLAIYVWGNSACSPDGAIPRFHLTEIASHGFVALVPGSILSGPKAAPNASGTQVPPTPGDAPTPEKMIAALDWILAENRRPGSPYYGALDPNRIAIGGNSCGGLLAMKASLDPRVRALAVQNSGTFPPDRNPLPLMNKADLSKLRVPILYVLGGPEDIAEPNGLDDFAHINQVPVFVADHPGTGHIGLFLEPYGEGTRIELAWLAWQMDGDRTASKEFVGEHCGLCSNPAWKVYRKGIQ